MPSIDKRRRKRGKGRAAILAGLFRSATSRARALPDFVVVGAQKCGTSSLYSYLLQHPNVLPAARKEVHFFDLNYQRADRAAARPRAARLLQLRAQPPAKTRACSN